MPNPHLTLEKIELYKKARRLKCTQVKAAAIAKISVSSGRKIDNGTLQPHKGKPRTYRTRKDPLVKVWNSVVIPLLNHDPELCAQEIFQHLLTYHPERIHPKNLRTLQRRVQAWKKTNADQVDSSN